MRSRPPTYLHLESGVRSIDSSGSVVWSLGNFLRATLSGPDGTSTYAHPTAWFYFLDLLYDVSVGFLSPFYLPALALGFISLIRRRDWAITALLVSWWLVPPLFFSGGLYQAHRFVIMYLPPLAAIIGMGVAMAASSLVALLRLRRTPAFVLLLLIVIEHCLQQGRCKAGGRPPGRLRNYLRQKEGNRKS